MCGISGIYHLDNRPVDPQKAAQMAAILRHRGPSDEGFLLWNTSTEKYLHAYGSDTIPEIKAQTGPLHNSIGANLAFAFRRLSIIDLSAAGHQPMSTPDGKIWIIFNGEIYNYIELRDELQKLGYQFKSGSDTEVLLNAYLAWGIDCLSKFNGMWSFCLWDARNQRLFCARDRFGVKPFNYYFDGRSFIFASELKALLVHDVDRSLNESAIYRSIKLNSFLINGDETYFSRINVLPHSHFLVIEGNHLRVQRYYDLSPDQFEKSRLSFNDAQAQYRELFVDAIKLRMRSDVEVGSTLSGGLDSSAIVSVAAHLTNRSFQTFSAYYTYDARYDERQWIDLVSRAHNLQDHYISVQPEQALQDFYRMTFFMDYPVLGSSYLSQYYVMKLAQQHGVTVLLDGQGSDEISAGYNHAFYRYYADLLRQFRFGKLMRDFPGYLRLHQKGAPWQKILKTLVALAFKESTIYRMEGKHAFSNPFRPDFSQSALDANILDLPTGKLANFSYNLLMNTMLQTLLHYEDRNSMSFSIESRVPFLDYRLVEFVFSLPGDYKISKHIGKLIHREALRPLVPKAIIERKDKVSFFSPGEAFWLKNEFRDYTQSVFTSNSFKNRGIYDISGIDKMYQRYLHGETQSGSILWKVFALEHWFRVFIDQKPEQWINY